MNVGNSFDLELIRQALGESHTILVPNTRLRDAIFRELAKQHGDAVVHQPKVFAIDIWIQSTWQQLAQRGVAPCCELRILNPIEEHLLWTRLVEQSLDRYPLLSPTETARSLSHAYQLLQQWQLAPNGHCLDQFNGIADVAAFQFWREAFTRTCQQQACVNLVDAVQQLLKLLPGEISNEQFTLINFNQPPPLYRQLLDSLPVASRHLTASDAALEHDDQVRKRRVYPDPPSEIRGCASWALSWMQDQPDARIGIICPDKELYQQDFARQLQQQQDLHATARLNGLPSLINSVGGPPLNSSGLIHDALLILGLNREQQQAETLCRLLRSPYILASEEERDARAHMEIHMRRNFVKNTSVHRFSAALQQSDKPYTCPTLAGALLKFRGIIRQAPDQQSALAWTGTFRDLLDSLGWPGTRIADQEQLLLLKWQQAQESFARASDLLGPMSISDAVRRLLTICQQIVIDHGYRPRARVSFYTPTEASGLRFDALWLLGFTDQNWPAPVSPSPFLPYDLQKQHAVPGSHSDVQFEQARSSFYQLCNSAGSEVIASYPEQHDNQEIRPSSFIRQFATEEINLAGQFPVNTLAEHLAGTMVLQRFDDLPVALSGNESIQGGQQLISDQSACPFRAFARHRMNVSDLEAFSEGLDARVRGTAIHRALEAFFSAVSSKRELDQLGETDINQRCLAAANIAIDYLQWAQPELMTPALRELERERLHGLLIGFIQVEKNRGDYQVIEQEKEIHWQFASLQLTLRIDRIDQLSDGTLAVIDYKSGKNTPNRQSWTQERPEDMQLPIYAVAGRQVLDREISVLALAHINAAKLGYSGLAEGDDFHPDIKAVTGDRRLGLDWQQLNENFQLRIDYLAGEIIAGHNLVDPSHGLSTCQYCGLQALCRIHQEVESHGEEAELHRPAEAMDD